MLDTMNDGSVSKITERKIMNAHTPTKKCYAGAYGEHIFMLTIYSMHLLRFIIISVMYWVVQVGRRAQCTYGIA